MRDTKKTWDRDFIAILLEAKNYRAFLRPFFRDKNSKPTERNPAPITAAEFSRRAGIASRSYALDILEGRKVPGYAAIDRLCRGLRLKGTWREYFESLVVLERTGNRDTSLNRVALLRNRLSKSLRLSHASRSQSAGFSELSPDLEISTVFAAAGTGELGASPTEIARRTRLAPEKIEAAIRCLTELELLETRGDRLYPRHAHLAFERLGEEKFFRADFKKSVQTAVRRLEAAPLSERALFLSSTVCVSSAKMASHRSRLREILYSFISEIEEAGGDSIAEITLGFSDNLSDART